MIGIVLPEHVRAAAGIPVGVPLAVYCTWTIEGGLRGLWVGELGTREGRRWPITRVTPEDAQAWIEAAK